MSYSEEQRKLQFGLLIDDARVTALRINESSATRARSYVVDLEQAAAPLMVPPENTGEFRCFDQSLAGRLRSAGEELKRPLHVAVPAFKFVEGPKATEEAFLRLWGNAFGYLGLTFPVALQQNTQLEPLADRDWIALMATIVVDLGIIFLTLIRPLHPMSAFMGGRRAHEQMRGYIKRRWSTRARDVDDLKSRYIFKHWNRYYIVLPSRQWTRAEGGNAQTRISLLENLLLPLDNEGFIKIVHMPLPSLRREATLVLQEAGWEKKSKLAPIKIYRLKTRDLDALDEEVENMKAQQERTSTTRLPLPEQRPLGAVPPIEGHFYQSRRWGNPFNWLARRREAYPLHGDRSDFNAGGDVLERAMPNAGQRTPLAAQKEHVPGTEAIWLDHLNDLDRQITAGERSGANAALVDGMKLIRTKLQSQLSTAGYRAFGTTGDTFDFRGNLHDAVSAEPSARPKGEILSVIEQGYLTVDPKTGRERVIRPAKVTVSSGPEEATTTEPTAIRTFRTDEPSERVPTGPESGLVTQRESMLSLEAKSPELDDLYGSLFGRK